MPEIRYKNGTNLSRVHDCRSILAITGTWRRILIDILMSESFVSFRRFSSDMLTDKLVEATGSVFVILVTALREVGKSCVQRLAHYLYEFSKPENKEMSQLTSSLSECIRHSRLWSGNRLLYCSNLCLHGRGITAVWRKHVEWLCCLLIEYIYQPELPLLADPQGQSALRWHIPVQITVLLIMFYCSNKRDLNPAVSQHGTVTAISTHSSCPRPLFQHYAVTTHILNPAVCGERSSSCPVAAGSHEAVRVSWPVWTRCIKTTGFYLRNVFRCYAICTARQM